MFVVWSNSWGRWAGMLVGQTAVYVGRYVVRSNSWGR